MLGRRLASAALGVMALICILAVLTVVATSFLGTLAGTPSDRGYKAVSVSEFTNLTLPGEIAIVLHVNRIDVTSLTAETTVELQMAGTALSQLWDVPQRRYVFKGFRPEPAFADLALTVAIVDLNTLNETVASYPLKAFTALNTIKSTGVVSAQTFGLLGDPGSFPNDGYSLRLSAFLDLPSGLEFRGQEISTNKLTASDVLASPALGSFQVQRSTAESTAPTNFQADFNLHVARNITDAFLGYALATLPLLLGIAVFAYMRTIGGGGDRLALAAGLAGAALTVLPLHAVLVPTDLAVITRLDLFLAADTAVLIGLAVISLSIEMWPSPVQTEPAGLSGQGRRGPGPSIRTQSGRSSEARRKTN